MLWRDTVYALRTVQRSPGFALVAVATIALGIGANTAMFSVVNTVVFKAAPYFEPDRLVMVWADNPGANLGTHEIPPTNADIVDWRRRNTVFESMAVMGGRPLVLSGEFEPQRLRATLVTHEFFPLVGVAPLLGRTFQAEEDNPGHEFVAVISHAFWTARLGADPKVLTRQLRLNGANYRIIGVMPPGFHFPRGGEFYSGYGFPARTDVWAPLALPDSTWSRRMGRSFAVIARLKRGVAIAQANAEMKLLAARIASERPETNAGDTVHLKPLDEQVTGGIRSPLILLLWAVGFVLLIACVNVANLLLARASARGKEIAIRVSVGATRGRIIRQLLTESVMLAAAGAAIGVLLAYIGVEALRKTAPIRIPRLAEASIDWRVAGFSLAITLATGIAFGLAPALRLARTQVNETLKEGGRGATRAHGLLREALVVSEVALSLLLLVGAGLLLRSFSHLINIDRGFETSSVLSMETSVDSARYRSRPQRIVFYQQLMARLHSLPGVVSASAVSYIPLGGGEYIESVIAEGKPKPPRNREPAVDDREILPGYFHTLGVKFEAGRDFEWQDGPDSDPVVIVNDSFAHAQFPSENAIGKRIKLAREADTEPWRTIVGIVSDVRSVALDAAPRQQIYRPYAQNPLHAMTVTLRANGDPAALAAAARKEINTLDPDLPVGNIRTMDQVVADSLAGRRFQMMLLAAFAGLAAVLAAVGMYGVISYSVSQRNREMGLRMALGARPSDMIWLVVGRGMLTAGIGVAAGIAGSLALTSLMRSMIYGVTPRDPATIGVVALLLAAVALAACYGPARRAARVDPLTTLRLE